MTHMPGWVLKLEGHVQHVSITCDCDGLEVLSIIDFMKLVCKRKSVNYATRTWGRVKKDFEVVGSYLYVPLPHKKCKRPPRSTKFTPATTRMGLQMLLLVLGDKVKDEFRQVDSALNRFILGDNSQITVVDNQ